MSAQGDERANSRAREQRMGLANRPRLEDYREKYAKHFKMERRDGILQVQMHTDGGPLNFNLHVHNDWPQLWMDIGNDPDNEVLIFTETGDKWIGGFDRNLAEQPIHEMPQDSFYDHIYWDATKLLEAFIFNIDIPTIACINGPGLSHGIRAIVRHHAMRRSCGAVRSALRRPRRRSGRWAGADVSGANGAEARRLLPLH
jgi:hypothetical protein